MTIHTDFRSLLPSAERMAASDHILDRMIAAPLNSYLKPRYSNDKALEDLLPLGARQQVVMDAWAEALRMYEDRYPIQWDIDAQKAYRMVNGRRVESA